MRSTGAKGTADLTSKNTALRGINIKFCIAKLLSHYIFFVSYILSCEVFYYTLFSNLVLPQLSYKIKKFETVHYMFTLNCTEFFFIEVIVGIQREFRRDPREGGEK